MGDKFRNNCCSLNFSKWTSNTLNSQTWNWTHDIVKYWLVLPVLTWILVNILWTLLHWHNIANSVYVCSSRLLAIAIPVVYCSELSLHGYSFQSMPSIGRIQSVRRNLCELSPPSLELWLPDHNVATVTITLIRVFSAVNTNTSGSHPLPSLESSANGIKQCFLCKPHCDQD